MSRTFFSLKSIVNIINSIKVPSQEIIEQAQHKIDYKTKPLGSLGKIESIAIKACAVQNTLSPVISNKSLFVFAADHGVAAEGVSAFPQEVTKQMVLNFLNNGAAINVLSNHNGINLLIVDIGVNDNFEDQQQLINKKIAYGTKNFVVENAMTREQAEEALLAGISVFEEQNKHSKIDIIGLGEMGIANTTTASAIISAITKKSAQECTGHGTGIDSEQIIHKINVIEKALSKHKPDSADAIDILSKIGGYEIAGMAGAALAAAANQAIVVLDGIISTAAGLIAYTINPDVANYFIAGHKSVEKGHILALKHMGLIPVLDLGMRLGEGTGAALTIDIVDASCKIMCEMASFEEAGVSNSDSV